MALLTLYHWTHRRNVKSIRSKGLHPDYAKTADKCVYLATTDARIWAEIHACARHKWNPGDLVCIVAYVQLEEVTASHLRGVFKTKEGVRPGRLWILTPIKQTRRQTRRRERSRPATAECPLPNDLADETSPRPQRG